MSDIKQVLEQRGARYGSFESHSEISQELKDIMRATPNWDRLDADMKEALEMTAHKIARILNGDPNYDDSWRDISGYVTLITNRLESK